MGLTTGTGPFGSQPAGRFNFQPGAPEHVLYLEDSPKRIRVELNGEVIADTTRTKLLHESGRTPVYYFPSEDVRDGVLEDAGHTRDWPGAGIARYSHVHAGDRVVERAAWTFPEPVRGAEFLRGLVTFKWGAMDAWYEEDEEVTVHPLDPYHRVDIRRSSRHVRILLDGTVLADSQRPLLLFETGLPTRYYLPPEDVDGSLLVPSEKATHCPYKGEATYHHVEVDGTRHRDLVWTYEKPLHDAEPIAGYRCFFNEKVDVEVDGAPEERPDTMWS